MKRAIVYGGAGKATGLKDFSFKGETPVKSLERRTGLKCLLVQQEAKMASTIYEIHLFEGNRIIAKYWLKVLKAA